MFSDSVQLLHLTSEPQVQKTDRTIALLTVIESCFVNSSRLHPETAAQLPTTSTIHRTPTLHWEVFASIKSEQYCLRKLKIVLLS